MSDSTVKVFAIGTSIVYGKLTYLAQFIGNFSIDASVQIFKTEGIGNTFVIAHIMHVLRANTYDTKYFAFSKYPKTEEEETAFGGIRQIQRGIPADVLNAQLNARSINVSDAIGKFINTPEDCLIVANEEIFIESVKDIIISYDRSDSQNMNMRKEFILYAQIQALPNTQKPMVSKIQLFIRYMAKKRII